MDLGTLRGTAQNERGERVPFEGWSQPAFIIEAAATGRRLIPHDEREDH